MAAKETVAAQEEELQAKETRYKTSHTVCRQLLNVFLRMLELVSNWHSLKATADAESELIVSEQQKVSKFQYID